MNNDIYLHLDDIGLAIHSSKFGICYVSEIYAPILTRIRRVKDELLIKALKLPSKDNNLVFDLTAVLGKDSILMAASGYNVIMVEQNPLLVKIIEYFIKSNAEIYPWVKNLHIIHGESLKFLDTYNGPPPIVIYLDPMFHHKKSALAKKDMQLIQMLDSAYNGVETNNVELFVAASKITQQKIIVKRDNKQEQLVNSTKVSYSIAGKTVRYDVYIYSPSLNLLLPH